jgi:hypothetical protein
MFFYKIEGNPFLADLHHMHKAMAPIDYPTTKSEIIAKIGAEKIKTGHDTFQTVKELVDPLAKDAYSCACDFYCAFVANLYKE